MHAVVVINTITAVIVVCEHLRAEAFLFFMTPQLLSIFTVVLHSYRSVENAFMLLLGAQKEIFAVNKKKERSLA